MRIQRDMPAKDYHAAPYLSASVLKAMRRSPAYAYWRMTNREETEAMRRGTAVHTRLFEPDRFESDYVDVPQVDRRTTGGKKIWADFEERHGDKIILSHDDAIIVSYAATAVQEHPLAAKLLAMPGDRELSLFAPLYGGIDCKARIDRIVDVPGFGRAILDVKTTKDASKKAFYYDSKKFGYDLQAAHYIAMARECGLGAEAFIIIAVETSPPWGVGVYSLAETELDLAYGQCATLARQWKECTRTGIWPGYTPDKIEILQGAA